MMSEHQGMSDDPLCFTLELTQTHNHKLYPYIMNISILVRILVNVVVDLGRDPSSPVPGYRLGSRKSVRLGRFH